MKIGFSSSYGFVSAMFYTMLLLLSLGNVQAQLVGSTPGSFDVDANGAATYSIPIQVPPGINGVEPKLSIGYNSQQGNGLLGVGWSLSGLQLIKRCAASINIDGHRSGIDFSSNRFCWNGQRLIPISSGTENSSSYQEYRTEIESFARIRAYGASSEPTSFKIWDKAGRILTFGDTEDSNFNPQGKGTLAWNVSKIEDRSGNYLTFDYTENELLGDHYLKQINYTSNDSAGITANRAVIIETETRPDSITRYVAGAKLTASVRIRGIRTEFDATVVRRYVIGYVSEPSSSNRSRLSSIQECGLGGEPACLAETKFSWLDGGSDNFSSGSTTSFVNSSSIDEWSRLIDFNNDGITDIFKVTDASSGSVQVALGDRDGSFSNSPITTGVVTNSSEGFSHRNELADFNGDGIADILRITNAELDLATLTIYFGQPDGTFDTLNSLSLANAITSRGQSFRFWNQVADMNADGVLDIFSVEVENPDQNSHMKFKVLHGSIDDANNYSLPVRDTVSTNQSLLATYLVNSPGGFRTTNQLADMNADGILDIFRVTNTVTGTVSILFGNSDGSFESAPIQDNLIDPIQFVATTYGQYLNYSNQLVDVNGDGVTDIVSAVPSDTNETLQVGSQTYQPCIDTSPCMVEIINSEKKKYTSNISVKLGLGNGEFTSAVISTGVVNPADIEINPSLDIADYHISSCGVPEFEERPKAINNGINDNYIVYTCSTPRYQDSISKGISAWNQFADINGDGYTDIMRVSSGDNTVKYSYGRGDGSFSSEIVTTQTVNTSGNGFRSRNVLSDFNGDGFTDILVAGVSSSQIHLSQRTPLSLLKSATNGVGLIAMVDEYKPLTDNTVYTLTPGVDNYPQQKVAKPRYVVALSSYQDDEVTPTFNYPTSYQYEDARISQRHGWLGFAAITRTEPNGLQTVTTFNQDYPFIGRPATVTTRLQSDSSRWLKQTVYEWGERQSDAGEKSRFVFEKTRTENTYEPNTPTNEVISSIQTLYKDSEGGVSNPYDAYGNPQVVSVTTDDGNDTTTSYVNDYDHLSLHLGSLVKQNVTTNNNTPDTDNNDARVRNTQYEYYADSGLLKNEIIEPTAPLLTLTTSYEYTPLGELDTVSVRGLDLEYSDNGLNSGGNEKTRSTKYAYIDGVGGTNRNARDITMTTTSSGLSEKNTVDNYWGFLKSTEDVSGVATSYVPDALGRVNSTTKYSGTTEAITTTVTHTNCGVDCVSEASYKTTFSTPGLTPSIIEFDVLDRQLRQITYDEDGTTPIYQKHSYDTAGRIEKISRNYYSEPTIQWTTRTYDSASRLETITEPNNALTTYFYSGKATDVTLTSIDEGYNRTTTTLVNTLGQVVRVTDADDHNTRYMYGPFGVLKQITDALTNSIVIEYDVFGNRITQDDPNMGKWEYRYNAFGELKWQKDANGNTTRWGYDNLGRIETHLFKKLGESLATSYDYFYDNPAPSKGVGRLDYVSGQNGYLESYTYDSVGRLNSTVTTPATGLASLSTTTTYDTLDRLDSITYPNAGPSIDYHYYDNGSLKHIQKSGDASTVYWQATDYNADNQITAESWGNDITSTRSYFPQTGLLSSIATGTIQNLSYNYYLHGNLQTRTNNLSSVTETFTYDELNRLNVIESTAPGVATQTIQYNAIGNITFKAGVGTYRYESSRPHAVTTIYGGNAPDLLGDADGDGYLDSNDIQTIIRQIHGTAASGNADCNSDTTVNILDVLCVNNKLSGLGSSYLYDDNGNMTSGDGRTVTYTAFNKPDSITTSDKTLAFSYDHNHNRLTKTDSSTNTVTTYAGKLYEADRQNSTLSEERFFITAAGRLVAVLVKNGATITEQYVHVDRLGSINVVTDNSGAQIESHSFDAFGLARASDWGNGAAQPFTETNRGYTGHEMDAEIGLVNMNARLYDPRIGRFISPDPIIPNIYNPQALNRYSYVYNNPLSYTDPTGHVPDNLAEGTHYWEDRSNPSNYVMYNEITGVYTFGNGATIGIDNTSTGELPNYSGLGEDSLSEPAASWSRTEGPGIIDLWFGELTYLDQKTYFDVSPAINADDPYLSKDIGLFENAVTGPVIAAGLATGTAGIRQLGRGVTEEIIRGAQFRNIRPDNGSSFFDIPGPAPRGQAIELAIGKNTPGNFQTIDRLDPNGEVVSIKSADLTLPSLLKENGLTNKVRADIRAVERFPGSSLSGFTIRQTDIQLRTLELVIQKGKASVSQRQQLNTLIDYGAQRNVELRVIEIP